jgi:putative transposase
MPEIKKRRVNSLTELNDLYFAWKKAEYDERIHSSIGMSPKDRWKQSLKKGAKLRFFSPVELEEIFLHAQQRSVNKYGVISFEGNTYEAPVELISKSVLVRYNPFHLEYLHIYYKDKYFGTAKIIDLKTQRHKSVGSIPEESGYDSEISSLYLENIKSNYQEYLEKQLNTPMNTSCVGSGPDKPEKDDEKNHPVHLQKQSEVSITRNEFIDIVKNAIDMPELTFQEKGKLNELWDTFKEFNKDILISILDDLSLKTKDFNRNFLYYIAQIRSLYLEKLSTFKEKDNE